MQQAAPALLLLGWDLGWKTKEAVERIDGWVSQDSAVKTEWEGRKKKEEEEQVECEEKKEKKERRERQGGGGFAPLSLPFS